MNEAVFISNLLWAFFFAAAIAVTSRKLNLLTKSGAAATFILGFLIFACGGWKWTVPIVTFFLLSSLLSKYRKKKNAGADVYFEKPGQRDYLQVMANGGAAGLFMILSCIYKNELFYYMYVSSIAAACADTWGTEIGNLKKTVTINIATLRKQEQGLSGGISLPGTLGAILGGGVVAASAVCWLENEYLYYICIIVLAGLTGSFIDSLLGATVQNQNRCRECSSITEKHIHCGVITKHYKGIKVLNNDAVNFISSLAGGIIVLFFL